MNSAERILKSFLPYLFMKQRKMRKEKETVTKLWCRETCIQGLIQCMMASQTIAPLNILFISQTMKDQKNQRCCHLEQNFIGKHKIVIPRRNLLENKLEQRNNISILCSNLPIQLLLYKARRRNHSYSWGPCIFVCLWFWEQFKRLAIKVFQWHLYRY